MTDYKQLCAELVAWAEKTSAHYYTPPEVLVRARAELAKPVIMTDYKQLCAELVAWAEKTSAHYYVPPEVLVRARAELAKPETDILDPNYESDLTEEEHDQLVLMSEHAVAPPLSPAARTVLDAFRSSHTGQGCLAAALRAVADHIDHDWSAFNCIDALDKIAAELDGPSYTSKSQEQRKRFLDFIEKATL